MRDSTVPTLDSRRRSVFQAAISEGRKNRFSSKYISYSNTFMTGSRGDIRHEKAKDTLFSLTNTFNCILVSSVTK